MAVEVPEPVVLAGVAGTGPEPWSVWEDVVRSGTPDRVSREVKASGLRGRGGAGFPAAVKWGSAAEAPGDGDRYLICNGDEGDPGSFVDRLLDGTRPAPRARGYGARRPRRRGDAGDRLRALRVPAGPRRAAGGRGGGAGGGSARRRPPRPGVGFDVEVFEGAGSYVAGEETSLIHSIEGLRGEVAARPPYPTERGYLHRPTVVNNVETLAAVPWIVARGGGGLRATRGRREPGHEGSLPERALSQTGRLRGRARHAAAPDLRRARGRASGRIRGPLDPGRRPARGLPRPARTSTCRSPSRRCASSAPISAMAA